MATTVAVTPPLPSRLMTFFAKYPPRLYSAYLTGERIPTFKQKIADEGDKKATKSAVDPTLTTIATEQIQSQSPIPSPASLGGQDEATTIAPTETETSSTATPASDGKLPPNPFLPYKNPATGRWRGAVVGLRQQAELFKMARVHGVEPLLPPSRKSSMFKQQRLLERGLAVKGTGEGQSVKGHKWERTMQATLDKRVKAMEEMPALIREWKQRGHGRGWKKYPK